MMMVKGAGRFLIFSSTTVLFFAVAREFENGLVILDKHVPCMALPHARPYSYVAQKVSLDAQAFDSGVAILPFVLDLVMQSNRHTLPYGKK